MTLAASGKPVMDLVAGPQGSGKSTFFPVADRGFDAFNIDDHRKRLNGGRSQGIPEPVLRQAAADYEAFIEKHLRDKASFSIEVTLANEVTFVQAKRARAVGFRVQLTYVAAAVDECVLRVGNRVDGGGHGVLPDVIRDTYDRSMKNLDRALAEFDLVAVYDNSRRAGMDDSAEALRPRLVLESQNGKVTYASSDAPSWLKTALAGTPFEIK